MQAAYDAAGMDGYRDWMDGEGRRFARGGGARNAAGNILPGSMQKRYEDRVGALRGTADQLLKGAGNTPGAPKASAPGVDLDFWGWNGRDKAGVRGTPSPAAASATSAPENVQKRAPFQPVWMRSADGSTSVEVRDQGQFDWLSKSGYGVSAPERALGDTPASAPGVYIGKNRMGDVPNEKLFGDLPKDMAKIAAGLTLDNRFAQDLAEPLAESRRMEIPRTLDLVTGADDGLGTRRRRPMDVPRVFDDRKTPAERSASGDLRISELTAAHAAESFAREEAFLRRDAEYASRISRLKKRVSTI